MSRIVCVVVRFWSSSRSRLVSGHLKASHLCQRAHKPDMGLRRKLQAHELKKKASGLVPSHNWSNITHLEPLLNRTCTTLQDANNHYKDPFLSVWSPFQSHPILRHKNILELATPATSSWIAWSLWFTDPSMLLDHPHVLNIVTPLYQCGLL